MLRLDRGSIFNRALLVLLTLTTLTTLEACAGDGGSLDGGGPPADGATIPTAVLEVVSEPSISLLFGTEATVRVLYRELDGSPITSAPINYALLGRANDSSLSSLVATTNAMGEATVSVLAGSTPSAFRVRVTAERAAPLLIDVSVSDAGFGAIAVTVEWDGTRMLHETEIAAFAGAHCDDESVISGDPDRARILADIADAAELRALPAEIGYAIAARGLGPTGARVAYGCIDDSVVVEADASIAVTVTMTDLPLLPDGSFNIGLEVGTTEPAAALGRAVTRGGRGAVESAGGGASFLLDALEAHLRARGSTPDADAVAAERTRAFLDDTLDTRLAADSVSPERALDALSETLEAKTAFVTVSGDSTLETTPDGLSSSFIVTSVTTHGAAPDDARLAIDLGALGDATEGRLVVSLLDGSDELDISELGASMPLGALGIAALASLAREARVDGVAGLLEEHAGCGIFEAWAGTVAVISSACDASCTHRVCKDALEEAAVAAQAALLELDAVRSVITVSGRVEARDEIGNRSIDGFDAAALAGRYESADGTDFDEVVAALRGARILE